MVFIRSLVASGLLFASFSLVAHPMVAANVVPQAERDSAQKKGFSGPKQNRGITSVKTVGNVGLASEFEGMQGRELRAREIEIAPGGVVAVHEHNQRPGIAYIVEGEIIEHRNDSDSPVTRRAGDAAFEKTGVVHWWENLSDKPVRALVVDIIPEKQ